MGASLGSACQDPTDVVQEQNADLAEEPPGQTPGHSQLPILENSCGSGCGSTADEETGSVIVDLDVPLSAPIARTRKSAVAKRSGRSESHAQVQAFAKSSVARVTSAEAKTKGKIFQVDAPHLPPAKPTEPADQPGQAVEP